MALSDLDRIKIKARARKRKAAQRPQRPSSQKSFAETAKGGFDFLNKALAEKAIGAPVDITNFLLSKVGLGSEAPIGGSKSIKKLLSAVGAPVPERAPETPIEKLGDVGGEVLGAMIPMVKVAQLLSKGTGVASGIARNIAQEFTERPARALAIEAAAVPGIAGAREIAEQKDLDPAAALALEIVGGMTPAAGVSLLTAPGRVTRKLGAKAIIPFTASGAKVRASRRIQELVDDPQIASKMVDDLKELNLSPATKTGEPALMALEESVLRELPLESVAASTKRAEVIGELTESIRKSGDIKDLKGFVQSKRERLLKSLDARFENAADQARKSLEEIKPANRQEANAVVRDSLEKALADAKMQEEMLWAAIPQDTKAPVSNTINSYIDIVSKLPSAQANDIPDVARRIIGGSIKDGKPAVKAATVLEMDGLFKRLGEESTAARAAGEFNKARIAENLRDAILKDFDGIQASGDVANQIKTARAFSRQLNQRFRKGPVGKLMGFSREGGQAVPTELTLERVIGAGGGRGQFGAQALQRATDDPNVMEGISEYLKAEFVRTKTTDGRLTKGAFESFEKKFGEILDMVPDTKKQLQTASTSEDVLRRITKSDEALRTKVQRKEISQAHKIVNGDVVQEIGKAMRSPQSSEVMDGFIRFAKRDKSGKSFEGLRAGFSEFLVDNITATRARDEIGQPLIDGFALNVTLQDPNVASALKKLYTPKEIKTLKDTAKKMSVIQERRRAKGGIPIIQDKPAWLLNMIGGFAGADIGARLSGTSGSSLRGANMGSKAIQSFLGKLTADRAKQMITDALLFDPDLMKALLTHTGVPKTSKSQERIIRAYMLSPAGSRLVDAEDRELARKEQN